jgi:hypothetical protein
MKRVIMVATILCCMLLPAQQANAQVEIIQIIKEAITKVIVAVDLQIQRFQNKTIWLQNAQKKLENAVSKLRLEEIRDWTEKQRKLYADYFEELRKVKMALTYFQRVKDIMAQQVQLVNEYKAAWNLFRQDNNFTADELNHLLKVYTGILNESAKNIDQLMLVINAFETQMTDGARLQIIGNVAADMEQQLFDLRAFNQETKLLSLQRASSKAELDYLKKIYGL